MRWAGVLVLIAATGATLGACGGDGSGDGAGDGAPDATAGPRVAFFIGGIGHVDATVCAATKERRSGTNVVTVRDHSRHYPTSVVRFEEGYESEARALAARLPIDAVAPMDAVTPTLFEGSDVAVMIGRDFECGP